MVYHILADLVLIIHTIFIIFVIIGGILVLKWRLVVWFHIPSAIWGILIEFKGWICPLTYLENYLRKTGDTEKYTGDFIQYYLTPVVYPPILSIDIQYLLGIIVFIFNIIIYSLVWRHWNQK